MDIIKNGKIVCSVIMPETPSIVEKFAFSELKDYIYKITGQILECNKKSKNYIIIGAPHRNTFAQKLIAAESFNKKA